MVARTTRSASGGTDVTMSDTEDRAGGALALDAHAATPAEVVGDPNTPLTDAVPVADPVQAATFAAARKARAGSSAQPLAGESVVMGADGRGYPVAVSSAPNPTTSAEIQEASALAVLRMTSHVDLTGEDGKELSGELFTDTYPAASVVYTKQRIYKTQLMPHSSRATSVLIYAANVAVPRGEAESFQKMMDDNR